MIDIVGNLLMKMAEEQREEEERWAREWELERRRRKKGAGE